MQDPKTPTTCTGSAIMADASHAIPGLRTFSIERSADAAAPIGTSARVAPRSTVAIVYHFFAHYRGGIIEELIKNGKYHFVFYGDTSDPFKTGIEAHGFSDSRRLTPTRSTKLGRFSLWQWGLVKLALRRDVPCLILLGAPRFLSVWVAAIVARLMGKRVLFWTQGWYTSDTGITLWLKNLFFRLSHGVLVYEHTSKALAMQHGFAPERLYVVHNSLDYERQVKARNAVAQARINEIRTACFTDDTLPVVAYVGRLIPSKNVHLLFDAAKLLHAQGHRVNLLIVGDGSERANLQSKAQAEGLDAYFYGACYEETKLAELFMSAQVMVSPGNVGLNAIHSLTYGTPVITHDNLDDQGPEVEAIVPGLTGELFQQGNVSDLARAIKNWTSKPPSQHEQKLGQQLVDRFYNPTFQRVVIERAVMGLPANDLFWLYEHPPLPSQPEPPSPPDPRQLPQVVGLREFEAECLPS
jgi:glycosyltransferase involved in cell wall biosynthesis